MNTEKLTWSRRKLMESAYLDYIYLPSAIMSLNKRNF